MTCPLWDWILIEREEFPSVVAAVAATSDELTFAFHKRELSPLTGRHRSQRVSRFASESAK
ncbi:MAG: hypothetical protein NTW75_10600 [Planctomycetales bacterium]|nr:hypothetical protein [Planctomycetales bacterium]